MAISTTSQLEIESDPSARLRASAMAADMQAHNRQSPDEWGATWAVDKMRVIFIQNAGFVAAFSPFRRESVMLAAVRTIENVNEQELTTARSDHPIEEWDQYDVGKKEKKASFSALFLFLLWQSLHIHYSQCITFESKVDSVSGCCRNLNTYFIRLHYWHWSLIIASNIRLYHVSISRYNVIFTFSCLIH